MSNFSFHNHTMYSILDGYATPEEYLNRAVEIGLKGFAITEHGNQYSYVYFDKIKHKYPSLKIVYGVEFYECDDINIQDQNNKYYHLLALARNERGRIALNELVTKSNFEGFYFKPRVDLNMLKPYANDLVITTACLTSKISREKDFNKCVEYIDNYKKIFPYFYLEMQSHKHEDQENYNKKIIELSKVTGIDFVITTDSHAARKEDLEYQAQHVQIARDDDTISEIYDGCYLQTEDEMHDIMDNQIGSTNVDIGLENNLKILDLIDNVDMPFQEPQLPNFPLPNGFSSNKEYLRSLVLEGWETRKLNLLNDAEQQKRKERLEYELEIISQMSFDGYFLIVWDFINWAKANGVMVGAGRGSGGSAIVCYLLGITELDPIEYNLIFERFLNPQRCGMPDLDIDVSDRDKVIGYLVGKYGSQSVCQIINFSYITPVVAIKDVGRTLGIPYQVCDKISKRFVYDTFEECMEHYKSAIEDDESLYAEYYKYKELFDIASRLSGRVRQTSVHAGGVGIVDTKITNYMGMKIGENGEHVIQVDKKTIESIGIIKFDILGLKTLVMIKEIMDDANIQPYDININNPKFRNDKKAYELLQNANTNAVFQVESHGMKDLLIRLKPTSLEELSAVLALYRPDSMSMLEDYIYYKHNQDDIQYWHEDMIPILQNTYGAIVYQEQVMDIVRQFGGRDYGGADQFRKGIGKKDMDLVKKEAHKLKEEIDNNGYKTELAVQISEYMEKLGGYSFNKSHSCLYAVICLQTAYLKANYPIYFYKALLNLNRDDNGNLCKYMIDAKDSKVTVLPPHINKSNRTFGISDGKILFGLEAIKGIGSKFVDVLIKERNKSSFKDFDDLVERTQPTITQIMALVKSGSIPTKNKKQFLLKFARSRFNDKEYEEVATLPTLKKLKSDWGIDTDVIKNKEDRLKIYNEKKRIKFYEEQILKLNKYMEDFIEKYLQNEEFWEFDALSIFITNNPFEEAYKKIHTHFNDVADGGTAVIAGVISNVTKKKDRHKKQFAFISLYTPYGLLELTCWHTQFKEFQELLTKGEKIVVKCNKKNGSYILKDLKKYNVWLKKSERSGNYGR